MDGAYLFMLHVPRYIPAGILRGTTEVSPDGNLVEVSLLVKGKSNVENPKSAQDIKRSIEQVKFGDNVSIFNRKMGIIIRFPSLERRQKGEKMLREHKSLSEIVDISILSQIEIAPILKEHIRTFFGVKTVFVSADVNNEAMQLTFESSQAHVSAEEITFDLWDTLQVGRSFGSLQIISLQRSDVSKRIPACVAPNEWMQETTRRLDDKRGGSEQTDEDDEEEEQLLDLGILHNEIRRQIAQGAIFSLDFVLMTITASLLAGVALAANNTVVVVASMLVSPLMGPILATVFGFIIQDWDMLSTSLVSELYALILCIISGFCVGIAFSPWGDILNWPNSEMASRGTVNGLLIGLGIAIPSGVGVALGILGSNTSSLVGVAISASLLPPAVNCGICWAYALAGPYLVQDSRGGIQPEVDRMMFVSLGGISFSLTLLNIGCIYIFAYLTFKAKIHLKYPGKTDYWAFMADELLEEEGEDQQNQKRPSLTKGSNLGHPTSPERMVSPGIKLDEINEMKRISSPDTKRSTASGNSVKIKIDNRRSMPTMKKNKRASMGRHSHSPGGRQIRSLNMSPMSDGKLTKKEKRRLSAVRGLFLNGSVLRDPLAALGTGDMRRTVRLKQQEATRKLRRNSMLEAQGINRNTLRSMFNRRGSIDPRASTADKKTKKVSRASLKNMFQPPPT